MTIRTLVVDDQPVARERLVALLAGEPDVQIVGTAASGPEAVTAIRRLAPDLVFLDVQLPELDGLGVIEAVEAARMPATIFVTAYDEYAVRAFDVHALDYLLKPFGRARFQRAIGHARQQLERARAGERAARLLALVDELKTSGSSGERLPLRTGGRVVFVEMARIDWIEAEGNYVRVHAGDGSHLVRETLTDIAARLGDRAFCRIHRSRLVNVSRIRELRFAAGGDYDVILNNGTCLGLSRLYRDAVQARLTQSVP